MKYYQQLKEKLASISLTDLIGTVESRHILDHDE